MSPLSSPEGGNGGEEVEDAARLTAEADYAADHNDDTPPGPTAADEGEIRGAGAPPLHSDQQPPQGAGAPDVRPDSPDVATDTVEEGDAGAPASSDSGAVASGSAAPPSAEPGAAVPEQPAPTESATADAERGADAGGAVTTDVVDAPTDPTPTDDVPSADVHAEPSTTDAPAQGRVGVQPETPAAEMLAGTRPIPAPPKKEAAAPSAAAARAEPVTQPEPTTPAEAAAIDPAAASVPPGGEVPAGADEPLPATAGVEQPAEPAVAAAEAQPPAAGAEPAAGPGPEPEPAPVFDERLSPLFDALREHLGDAVLETTISRGPNAVARIRTDAWRRAAEVCRDRLGLTYFCFLSAVDWMPSPYGKSEESGLRRAGDIPASKDGPFEHGAAGGETRFQLLARLERPTADIGLTLKADLGDDLTVDTWVGVFAGADWHERETAEMFGIDFRGHPNQVHIYLPGEFEGFPLRKDFPLLAREVKPWPGLVDVEPMPGEGPEAEPAEGAEEVSA